MKKALYAGTFSPPTLGHLDVIQRASFFFDILYVGVALNSSKSKDLIPLSERLKMLEEITKDIPQVKVVSFSELTVEFCKKNQVSVLIRSLRGSDDYQKEYSMAACNKEMAGIETFFLLASPAFSHISSSLVREIIQGKGSLKGLVPPSLFRFFI